MKRSILISVSLLYSRNDRNIVAVEFERTSSCSSVAGATNLNGDASIHYPVQHAFCEIGVREWPHPYCFALYPSCFSFFLIPFNRLIFGISFPFKLAFSFLFYLAFSCLFQLALTTPVFRLSHTMILETPP